MNYLYFGSWLGLLFLGTGCVTSHKAATLTHEDQLRLEKSVALPTAQLEKRFKRVKDVEVTRYLNQLGHRLLEVSSELQVSLVDVVLIQNKGDLWRNYSFPKGSIYLSVDLLKQLKWENEIVALLALQIAHLSQKSVFIRVQELYEEQANAPTFKNQASFEWPQFVQSLSWDKDGIFDFSVKTEEAAIKTAVQLLYLSGYDARGLISLYLTYQNQSNYSPYAREVLGELLGFARQEVAFYPPLRNPIVASPKYLFIHKRIQNL